jgi:hypothetical protein
VGDIILLNKFSIDYSNNFDKDKLIVFAFLLIGLVIIFSYGVGNVSAATGSTIYVNGSSGNDSWNGQLATWNGTSGPKATIKSATNTVQSGGTVSIANGVYNENNIIITKNMNIVGQTQQSTIIDGNNTNSIFFIQSGIFVTIKNLTLTNGTSSMGGAISNLGMLSLNNTTLMNNTATSEGYGGAITNQGTLNIDNSIFSNNTATSEGFGGAIFNSNGMLNVNNSTFTGNTAGDEGFGGAIENLGILVINGSNFIDNSAGYEGFGGSIYNDNVCNITSSIFTNNSAIGGFGGAIFNSDKSLNVTSSIFIGNTIDSSSFGTNIYNGGGSAIAPLNWWSSNSNPSSSVSGMAITSWLVLTITANPNYIINNGTSIVTADLLHDNLGNLENITLPDELPVYFNTTLGTIDNSTSMVNGIGYSNLNCDTNSGTALISATLNNQTVQTTVKMDILPTVTANPEGGLYNNTLNVQLIMNEPGTIYYTTNGATPTINSLIYNNPITLTSNTTLEYIAIDLFSNQSPVYTDIYNIDTIPPTATANPTSGIYNSSQNVTLTMSEPGTIYYTTDGTDPNNQSTTYKNPITINKTTTLKYIATDLANNQSPIFTQNYTINTTTTTATANPTSGIYRSNQNVTLTMSEPGTIYYTLNGTTPTDSSSVYTSPIKISTNTTLKYIAIDLANNQSPIYTQYYTIDNIAPIINTITPTANSLNTPNPVIKITFSELVKAGTMWIELKNSAGKLTQITTSISGNVLTIYHSTLYNGRYFLSLHTGSITDMAGNPITLSGSSFLIDSIPPTVQTVNPTSNAFKIPTNQRIKITFSEPIKYSKTFWIELKNSSGTEIPFTSSISGKTLNIKPKSPLSTATQYIVLLHSGSVTDIAGNGLKGYSTKFTTFVPSKYISVYGVSFNYPISWNKQVFDQDGTKITMVYDTSPYTNPDDSPAFEVQIQPNSASMSNQEALDLAESCQDFGGSTKIICKKITIFGQPAYENVYIINNLQDFSETMQDLNIIFVKNKNTYTIDFTVPKAEYNSEIPNLNTMLSSFKIQ